MSEVSSEPEGNIRHRLVGALVLVALAVIFLPMIFDGKEMGSKIKSKIPPKPIMLADVTLDLEEAKLAEETFKAAAEASTKGKTTEVQPEQPTEVDQERPLNPDHEKVFIGQAFVLRVGTFKNFENAETIKQRLEQPERNAFVKTVTYQNGKKAFQVFLGPDLNEEKVNAWQAELKTTMKLDALVEVFNPSTHTR